MNTTAKGTERQHAFSSAVEGGTGDRAESAQEPASPHATAQSFETSDQLRRILAEVQNSRLAGNAALRDLENRLGALEQFDGTPFDDDLMAQQQQQPQPGARRGWNARDGLPSAPMTHAALPEDERQEDFLSLSDRLRELSSYLHASLAQRAAAHAAQGKPSRAQTARYHGYTPQHHSPEAPHMQGQPRFFSERQPHPRVQTQPVLQPKLTPTAPVLDRAWFEDRFTQLRHSIDDAAEVPTKRIDALEEQFRLLMERLDARENAQGGMGAVEAGLKNLAAYLDDSKKWATQHDRRQRNVEDRLDQLSGLVAQSHAAISATAKGLEIVARGTGSQLAQHTANLVTAQVEEKIARLQPGPQLDNLSRELANLTTQQRQYARSTDQRLKELQVFLESAEERYVYVAEAQAAQQTPALQGEHDARASTNPRADRQIDDAAAAGDKHSSTARQRDIDEGDDYDRDLIAAAQRAARLAEGPRRDAPAHGETVRYQIPYGEFLPEEGRRHSHLGLIAAAVILLLASAAMLYVNLREKDVFGWARDRSTSADTMQERTTATEPAPQPTVPTPPINTTAAIRKVPAPASDEAALNAQPSGEKDKAQPGALSATEIVSAPGSVKTQSVAPLTLDKGSLNEAAVAGEPSAQFAIGQKLLTGNGHDAAELDTRERLSMAARWFRRAAEKGHAPSQYRLATLFELGQGAPKDYLMAEAWYRRAAETGHVKAMHNLAVLAVGARGGNANYLTAAKWFAKAAEYGLTDSQYNLAILYERGMGVEPSQIKAYQWYAIAARLGDAKAAQKRDALVAKITAEERTASDTLIAGWTPQPRDPKTNGVMIELPAKTEAAPVAAPAPAKAPVKALAPVTAQAHPAAKAETPRVQTMRMSWSTEVQTSSDVVMRAQRSLLGLGYKVGKADGMLGARTIAATREFEISQGMEPTGRVDEALVERLAFAQR